MTARAVVDTLLEAGPDDIDPRSEVARYSKTSLFDEGVYDILDEARQLYERLVKGGVIRAERGVEGSGIWQGEPYIEIGGTARRDSRITGFDSSSLAQAVLRLAIERRGSLGGERAYKLIRKHGHSIL